MNILGISAFYHDSAAALVSNGRIIAAAQEERFTRRKHDNRFPLNVVTSVLQEGQLGINDVDVIVFYEKPFLKMRRIFSSFLWPIADSGKNFIPIMETQIKKRFLLNSMIRKSLKYRGKVEFVKHHQSHAASAFYPSPFERAAFLTVDGVGEWETTTYGTGCRNEMEFYKRINYPHSLGLFYAAFTYFLGFKVNSGEYKVMGLAPYGEPKYFDMIMDKLIDLKDDGSFRLNMEYFSYITGDKMTNQNFGKIFKRSPRGSETEITQDDMDIASSIQKITDEIMLRMVRHVRKETGEKYLCLAGGVALNCVANGKILEKGIFNDIWVQPAAGDAGGALGAALYYWHHHLKKKRPPRSESKNAENVYLGPMFDSDEIKEFLDLSGIPYRYYENIEDKTAELLAGRKIVGWFSGRMEFGPRALGNRSILGDARERDMQRDMNLKIKYRESFRPFAPSVLKEKAHLWFDVCNSSPFMLFVFNLRKDKQIKNEECLSGLDKLKAIRSEIPAVTHVDSSARVQTVSQKDNEKYYKLIKCFEEKTDCPVIINTSFNVRGEPIVCTPEDAFRCFMRTEMDYLVLENFLIDKKDQKIQSRDNEWKEEFLLD